MPDTTVDRPEPARGELAERADTMQRTRTERAVSEVGYYAPELAAATTLGGVGTLLWHPALAAVAAAGFAARVLTARISHTRAHRERLLRQAQEVAETNPFATGHTTEDRTGHGAAGQEVAG